MPDSTIHANEEQYPWELEPDDTHRAARIRMRTFVSADRTATSGISMGVFEMPPGALLDPHHHHPQEVYYVIGAEAEIYLRGHWRPLRKGDVVYVAENAIHGARNRGEATCTIVWGFPTDSYDETEYFGDRDVDG